MSAALLAFAARATAHAEALQDRPVVEEAYRQCFASEAGRLVLMDLAVRHQILTPSFLPGTASLDACYLDGIKAAVSDILTRALSGGPPPDPHTLDLPFPSSPEVLS